jgi:hypothetical protein
MGCRAEKFPLVFVINPSPGAGGSPGLQGSRRREGSTAIGFALGSIRQTEILGLHGRWAFPVHERSMMQDSMDIGFRKHKCRYSEKASVLDPSSPSRREGQGRVLSDSPDRLLWEIAEMTDRTPIHLDSLSDFVRLSGNSGDCSVLMRR